MSAFDQLAEVLARAGRTDPDPKLTQGIQNFDRRMFRHLREASTQREQCDPSTLLMAYHHLAEVLPDAIHTVDEEIVRGLVAACGCSRDGPRPLQGKAQRDQVTRTAAKLAAAQRRARAQTRGRGGLGAQRMQHTAAGLVQAAQACDYAAVLQHTRRLTWDPEGQTDAQFNGLIDLMERSIDHAAGLLRAACACKGIVWREE